MNRLEQMTETSLWQAGRISELLDEIAALKSQEPVAYWIPKAEQFCIANPDGRPFVKAWEPLFLAAGAQPVQQKIGDKCAMPMVYPDRAHEYYAAQEQAQERKPLFGDFLAWAIDNGYDTANTCNSNTGKWICLNPMTGDLWKAWQAAHGIKEMK